MKASARSALTTAAFLVGCTAFTGQALAQTVDFFTGANSLAYAACTWSYNLIMMSLVPLGAWAYYPFMKGKKDEGRERAWLFIVGLVGILGVGSFIRTVQTHMGTTTIARPGQAAR